MSFSNLKKSTENLSDSENPIFNILDKICAVLLVLCPILQYYDGIVIEVSAVILVLLLPYFGIRLLLSKVWVFGAVLPLILLSLYEILNHGTSIMEVAREALLVVYFIAAASGVIDLKFFIKSAVIVALSASGLIVIQYFCYYILNFHLQLVPTSLLDPSAAQWIRLAQTGRISVSGNWMSFYRPSAFFLEPSHMTLYFMPLLIVLLFSKQFDPKKIIIVAILCLGVILSTSGMGIMLVMCIWCLYLFLRMTDGATSIKGRIKKLFAPKNLIYILVLLVILIIAYFTVEPFRMSVNRIFVNSSNGNNAITGRTRTGFRMIKTLKGWEFLIGKHHWGGVSRYNMTGFSYPFYTQGLIGLLLSYAFYVLSVLKARTPYRLLAFVILGLSFFTLHTNAAYYMLYYVLILLFGYDKKSDKFVVGNNLSYFFEKLLHIKKSQ